MPIAIHGKEYITVAERLQQAHEKFKEGFDVLTEVIATDPVVVIKATLKIGEHTYTGMSAANPTKTIEKQSPYEVAETSAIGRALGFAGYGAVEGIATADEMNKGGYETQAIFEDNPFDNLPDIQPVQADNCKKCGGPTTLKISQSATNPGREYYACPIDKFSHWASKEET